MIACGGDAALAPRARSQWGGGVCLSASTLMLANGSSIDGNTADVKLPAFALASGLVVGSPSHQPTLGRCERETVR